MQTHTGSVPTATPRHSRVLPSSSRLRLAIMTTLPLMAGFGCFPFLFCNGLPHYDMGTGPTTLQPLSGASFVAAASPMLELAGLEP